jgi:hypothetical protein
MDRLIVKNKLRDKTCARRELDHDHECYRFLGEAVGWQWWPIPKERTCDYWKEDV